MKRIALFPGSFDPITVKHAHNVRTLLADPNIRSVLFFPTGNYRFGGKKLRTSNVQRNEMATLFVQSMGDSRLILWVKDLGFKVRRPKPLHLEAITRHFSRSELVLAVGSDALFPFLRELGRHRHWGIGNNRLGFHVFFRGDEPDLAAVRRGVRRQFDEFAANLDPKRRSQLGTVAVDEHPVPVSVASSDVRSGISRGEPVEHLVPTSVLDYIQKHKFYQTQ